MDDIWKCRNQWMPIIILVKYWWFGFDVWAEDQPTLSANINFLLHNCFPQLTFCNYFILKCIYLFLYGLWIHCIGGAMMYGANIELASMSWSSKIKHCGGIATLSMCMWDSQGDCFARYQALMRLSNSWTTPVSLTASKLRARWPMCHILNWETFVLGSFARIS